jgi:hypothetical protein
MVNYSFSGGSKMKLALQRIQSKVAGESLVRVGFLENATYPVTSAVKQALGTATPLHVATVAWMNNFGTSRAKARPFFSDMIDEQSPTWGSKIANGLRATNYNTTKTLRLLGIDISDALVTKIQTWPADNAPATVAKKGFNKGLIESAVMERNVDYEVIR